MCTSREKLSSITELLMPSRHQTQLAMPFQSMSPQVPIAHSPPSTSSHIVQRPTFPKSTQLGFRDLIHENSWSSFKWWSVRCTLPHVARREWIRAQGLQNTGTALWRVQLDQGRGRCVGKNVDWSLLGELRWKGIRTEGFEDTKT